MRYRLKPFLFPPVNAIHAITLSIVNYDNAVCITTYIPFSDFALDSSTCGSTVHRKNEKSQDRQSTPRPLTHTQITRLPYQQILRAAPIMQQPSKDVRLPDPPYTHILIVAFL